MAIIDTENLKGSALIPQDGAQFLSLPTSLESDSGSGQTRVIRNTLTIVAAVAYILYAVSILFRADENILLKLLQIVFWGIIAALLIRFGIQQEYRLRRLYTTMEANHNNMNLSTLWGISSVSTDSTHLVTYRGGTLGVFVEFIADTTVGKPDNDEYLSYEGISDALREAHRLGLNVEHYDIMDFIGEDSRLTYARSLLAKRSTNSKMRDTVSRMYNHLEKEMSYRVYSRDIYCFTSRTQTDIIFLSNVDSVCSQFMQANYKSHRYLNQEQIGGVLESVYGFSGFSVNQAIKDSYEGHNLQGVLPMKYWYPNGTEQVLNELPIKNTAVKRPSKASHKRVKKDDDELIEL